ncbi:uncharacterized protein BDCG_04457 [Blastomyces dermatitidis ER-3]|uniref:Uncharacterized protein n=1 Tax=Ajellomyces dermatitidis (strain ER-3 / ATCC MYA-2586) TaxID=559297 RepID=A0ABP2EYM7_AJEDR|nr:uncharacterized protein BDCG_04457 [Blastomyces dermatitidis ER-3]EEQ89337.1 hypothetical protein BDCG_04457 [Blastomyces dermatitidis ER-3]
MYPLRVSNPHALVSHAKALPGGRINHSATGANIELALTVNIKIMMQKIALIFKVKEMSILDDSLNSVNIKKKQASE